VVEQFDQLCLVESDKATTPITSRYDGTIVKLHYEEGDMAKTGAPLCDIEVDDDTVMAAGTEEVKAEEAPAAAAPAAAAEAEAGAVATGFTGKNDMKMIMTPAVRRIVKENNVDLNMVTATGKDNRVLKEDVMRFLDGEQPPVAQAPPAAAAAASPPPPPPPPRVPLKKVEPLAADQVHPIRGLQRTMAKTMVAANQVPHFGYYDECVLDGLVVTRAALKDAAAARGIRLSYMPFIMKVGHLPQHCAPPALFCSF